MVSRDKSRFKIGDWIVHYFHGVGKVKDIVKKGLDGNKKTFYKVTTSDIDYLIPIDDEDADHIEPIRSKQDFEDALYVLAKSPEPISEHHKSRKKLIHDRWLEGDLISRAELLRDLNGRQKLEKLSFSEKEVLAKIENYFINEWIITNKSLTKKTANKRLHKALITGVNKARKNIKD